jgi:hypothetical protein
VDNIFGQQAEIDEGAMAIRLAMASAFGPRSSQEYGRRQAAWPLEGHMLDIDATVVERILDAGGTIVGKAHCEAFCLSGGSHTNATG